MLQAYLELKLSWELFKKAPETLSAPERNRLEQVASKQNSIEQRILASAEAANVMIPQATVDTRLREIRGRYPSDDEFHIELEKIGLSEALLADAVIRDLRVEAVLDRVASKVPEATDVDAEIFYRLHPDTFDRPAARRLRHILITFNTPRERTEARTLLESLRLKATSPQAFADAALRHSQCPTAMQGGELGTVKLGQLYAELEPAAFALAEHQISDVLESPIGLHIVRCDEILPSGMMSFASVRERIIERLTAKRRSQAQREWIARLPA